MDIIQQIRYLARSAHWQNIYNASKEIGSVQLFENTTNHSGLQSLFLYWVKVYDLLYSELGQKEWRYLDDEVIKDDDRCDAFLYWRGLQRENELNRYKNNQKVNNLNFENPGQVTTFDVDFER